MSTYSCDGCSAVVETPDYINPTIVLCAGCNGGNATWNCLEYGVTYGPGIDDVVEEEKPVPDYLDYNPEWCEGE